MEETIDFTIVYAKTPKGVAEINARSGALTLQARRVLIMIDGRRPVAELMAVVRTGEFDGIMSALETQHMIEKVDVAVPPRNYEEDDFADTISLLQENAAALRSVPHVTPAEVVAAQARPATISIEHRIEPRAEQRADAADAAAIAARAVATASAPRTVEAAMRRPPTVSAPLAANDMAAGSTRPGTMNGSGRVPDHPVRRPPTLSGARPATAPTQDHGGAAVEAPVRPVAEKQRFGPKPSPRHPPRRACRRVRWTRKNAKPSVSCTRCLAPMANNPPPSCRSARRRMRCASRSNKPVAASPHSAAKRLRRTTCAQSATPDLPARSAASVALLKHRSEILDRLLRCTNTWPLRVYTENPQWPR